MALSSRLRTAVVMSAASPRTCNPPGPPGHKGDLTAVSLHTDPVHGLGHDVVDVDDLGLGQGVSLLKAGELDDLLDQDAQAAGLLAHAPGVVAHEGGVVGAGLDGLGQQLDRADRGLELVGDIGDEVAAHGLHPAGGGAVLDEDEDAPPDRCRPRAPAGGTGPHRAPSPRATVTAASCACPEARTRFTITATVGSTTASSRTMLKV